MNQNAEFHYFGKDIEAMSLALNQQDWILSELKPYLKGSVGEVGAGSGNFTELVCKQDISKLTAFEPSANMYSILAKRFLQNPKVTTHNGYLADSQDTCKNKFECMVYINVLEHIQDDRAELKHIHTSLKEKGVLFIFVPSLSFLYSDFDKTVGHYRRYHKKPLVNLVTQAGFNILKAKYMDMPGIIPWYLSMVLLKGQLNGGKVSLYDKVAIPLIRKFEKIIVPPLGKNLLVIAQKKSDR